jgi:hypothetical protein
VVYVEGDDGEPHIGLHPLDELQRLKANGKYNGSLQLQITNLYPRFFKSQPV